MALGRDLAPLPGSTVEPVQGHHADGVLPRQGGSQTLGGPGLLAQRPPNDSGAPAAEADVTPESKGLGARPQRRDLCVDRKSGPTEGLGAQRNPGYPVLGCAELFGPLPFHSTVWLNILESWGAFCGRLFRATIPCRDVHLAPGPPWVGLGKTNTTIPSPTLTQGW